MSGKESEIPKIIEKLTTTGKKTLEQDLLKKLKNICKTSDDCVNYAYYALMTQLRKEHSEIRYSALLVIDELFCRSSAFRKLLENDLDEFLELVAETNLDCPLPLPQARAKDLKLKGLELMKAWTSKFGKKYLRFEMGLNFLKQCKKVDFDDMEARSVAQREQQRREEERIQRIVNEKVDKVKTEMRETRDEISSILLQMENCFRLIIPHPTDDFFSKNDFAKSEVPKSPHGSDCDLDEDDDSNSEKNYPSTSENSLRHHGIYDMKKSITIELTKSSEVTINSNDDNQPLIENINDLHKQLSTRYYPMVTKWLKILTKGSNCTDALKQAIDLKQLIESSFEKFKDLKIKPGGTDSVDEEDDDDFIEVKEKDGYEAEPRKESRTPKVISQPSCSKKKTAAEKAFLWKFKHSDDDIKDPTSAASTLSKRTKKTDADVSFSRTKEETQKEVKSKKAELLDKAPVLPYDIDLYHWEDEKPVVPEVVKFDSLHKFWESKNDDDENETLKAMQIASLRTRKIDFSGKFEPVKWACRTPLPSGKLCPRKDRYKCPFHGKIIKRDSTGNPVNKEDVAGPSSSRTSADAVPEWQDPELLRDLEAATGINLKIPEKRGKGDKKGKKQENEMWFNKFEKSANQYKG